MDDMRTPIFGGAFVIRTREYKDDRGTLFESYREETFGQRFVQGTVSISRRGVIRGLHYQVGNPQGKFIRTLHGATFNVIVDMRAASPAPGRIFTTVLDRPEIGLWVPPGFANGFAVLQHDSVTSYETTAYYDARHDRTLFPLDPVLAIPWPADVREGAIISHKDRTAPTFDKADRVPASEWAVSEQGA